PARDGRESPSRAVSNREMLKIFALAALPFLAFALYASLIPLEFQRLPLHEALVRFAAIRHRELSTVSRMDALANTLLFVPIGTLLMGALRNGRSGLVGHVLAAGAVGVATAAFATGI